MHIYNYTCICIYIYNYTCICIYIYIELRQILNHQRWVYGRQDSNKEELSRKNGD